MSKKSEDIMIKESEILNMHPLPPLYYQQQVEWGVLLLHSIEDLPQCWQKKKILAMLRL